MKAFCERLRELRKDANLTAKMLAKEIGVSDATIIRWENGNITPSIDHLYNIAKYFGVSSDYLIGLED